MFKVPVVVCDFPLLAKGYRGLMHARKGCEKMAWVGLGCAFVEGYLLLSQSFDPSTFHSFPSDSSLLVSASSRRVVSFPPWSLVLLGVEGILP